VFQEEFEELDVNKDGVIDYKDVAAFRAKWYKDHPLVCFLYKDRPIGMDPTARLATELIESGRTKRKTRVLLSPITSGN